jgi:hypothetical protein
MAASREKMNQKMLAMMTTREKVAAWFPGIPLCSRVLRAV